ncbi:MAG: glycosyltransferase family 2 protein [Deltaproteobacteria bacterium]|nr:glycosyltransferase family 2 protein [Deltaproteobacteria bacterium]
MQKRALQFLSLVIPVYNEEETLPFLRESLAAWLPSLGGTRTEVILVDDGSADASLAFLEAWSAEDPRIKVLSFSRNFGHQAAVTAGLKHVRGDACVIIDADLQDPLAVIPEMIKRYEEGYDVVYGQRRRREGETFFKRCTAWIFYRTMERCMNVPLPLDTGDFRLVSRACIDAVNAMPESHRFLRGMFAWVGFAQAAVPYARDPRKYGETKYPLRKMLSFAWQGISSFSTLPIRLVSYSGMCIAVAAFVAGLYAMTSYVRGDTVQGWTALTILLAGLGGMILLGLGIIGEYVGKIYEEVKGRPGYIIQRSFNLDKDE